MRFPAPQTLTQIAQLIGARIVGDPEALVYGINEIHRVEPGDLVFVDHPKYYDKCIQSSAQAIIIKEPQQVPSGKGQLIVDDPFESYQTIIRHFKPFHPAAQPISESAMIGHDTYVAPGVFIGEQVSIGHHCRIDPQVVIHGHCRIGDHVIIQSGTIIGSDAFYYNSRKNREVWYRKMESGGRVIIEDEVEIGAGCTIDRGVTHDTLIGRGTKLDNLIHIGHDCHIGKNCLIAAQVGIAGGVNIGNGVGEQGGCMVHNAGYDFNDAVLSTGASYWVKLVEAYLPAA